MLVHITKHSGKMTGIDSISTPSADNEHCNKMKQCAGSICAVCYSTNYEAFRPSMVKALHKNTITLGGSVLPMADLPYINANIFRFSSFGDLLNVNHAVNLLNIAHKNPHVFFGFWTKRANLVQAAVRKVGKPDNVALIYSSLMINKKANLPKYFDKTFTIYDGDYDKINCEAKSCFNCMLCYSKNNVTEIAESIR